MANIGFIGTGTIGSPIAMRLIEDGNDVEVFDVNPHATDTHVDAGAKRAESVAAIAQNCQTVFLSLPGPPQIEEVVLGDRGLLKNRGALATIVDLSTNAIALNRRIAEQAQDVHVQYLDAPVSGGKIAAQKGSLSVMIGGDEAAFNEAKPLIESFGEHIFFLGPAGAGTVAKLINNQIFLSASVLIQEGFVLGAKAGMDPTTLLEVLKVSSAGTVVTPAPLVLSKKFDADIFALGIASKDIDVALDSAADLGVETPLTNAAAGVYHRAIEQGLAGEDFYATAKVLEAQAGVEIPKLKKPQSK